MKHTIKDYVRALFPCCAISLSVGAVPLKQTPAVAAPNAPEAVQAGKLQSQDGRARDGGEDREVGTASATLAEEVKRLRTAYPDRYSLRHGAADVLARLRARWDPRPPTGTEAGESTATLPAGASNPRERARAMLLSGELLLSLGATHAKDGREILRRLIALPAGAAAAKASAAVRESIVKALFLLGDDAFFRGRLLQRVRTPGDSAVEYWRRLVQEYPTSEWARVVQRPLRYLTLRESGDTPGFRQRFRRPDGSSAILTPADLRGRLVVLNFWSSSLQGQQEFEEGLARDVLESVKEFPVLRGRVEILGVNLDANEESFQKAVKEWKIPWPQAWSKNRFDAPLPTAFAIPRLPHWAVIDPEGGLVYLGGNRKSFYKEVTRALRAHRVKLEGSPK